jgi:hypothetical protein
MPFGAHRVAVIEGGPYGPSGIVIGRVYGSTLAARP